MTTTSFHSADDTSTSIESNHPFECEDADLSTCNIERNDTFSYEHTRIQTLFARACKDTENFNRVSVGNMPFADYRVELHADLYANIDIIGVPGEDKYLIVPSHPSLKVKVINSDGSLNEIGKSKLIATDTWLEIGNVKVFLPKVRKSSDKNHPLENKADLLFEAERLLHTINDLNSSMSFPDTNNKKELANYLGKLNLSLIQRIHESAKEIKHEIIEAILADEGLNGKEEDIIEDFLVHNFGAETIINDWVTEMNFENIEVRVSLLKNYANCLKEILEKFVPEEKQHHSPREKKQVYPNKLYENIIHLGKHSFSHFDKLRESGLTIKHAFKVRGTYFSCSDFFDMGSNRVGAFSIVSSKKFEKVLRFYYLSNSHCCFRLLPAVNHVWFLPTYDKAGNEVILAPPAEVQMNFANILRNNKVLKNISKRVFEKGVPENYDRDDILKYMDDTIRYPAKRSVQEILNLIEPQKKSREWRDPSELEITHAGEAPNFAELMGKYKLKSKFMGNIGCYIFRSFNQEVEYIVSRTKNNEVWFSSITSLKGPLNNFGLPKFAIDAHELSTSLYEYTSTMDAAYIGETHPTKTSYSKVVDYHSEISYLNQFKLRYIRS